jgi:hypothetical protein
LLATVLDLSKEGRAVVLATAWAIADEAAIAPNTRAITRSLVVFILFPSFD